jgi:arylsulfatase A
MTPLPAALAVTSLAALTACAGAPAAPTGAAPSRPNIVFILADDLGYGDPHCYNSDSKIPTPNIDRLAAQGLRFTDAHSPSAVCSPTRYGILTGRYAWRTRLKSSVLWSWDPPLIEPGRLTMPTMLRQHGYRTACIGKWHLGWNWPTTDDIRPKRRTAATNVDFSKPITGGPLEVGFEYYFGDDVPNFPPYCYIENDRTIGIPSAQKPKEMFGAAGPMLPGWDLTEVMPTLTEKAVAYIESSAADPKRPFFLYFSLTAPHAPIAPATPFQGKSSAGHYGDFVHEVDWTVGQVMQALERTGLAEDTLIVFTSDNGSPGRDGTNMQGPTGSVERFGHHPSGDWRGMKADIWEGGHRVPLLVRWPGRTPGAAISEELICQTDFFATFAAILDQPLADDAAEDSLNLLPTILGAPHQTPVREAVVHHSFHGMFAIRKGDWKLILGLGSGGFSKPARVEPAEGEPAGQLYNLASDPEETTNRYADEPQIVAELTALLEQYQDTGRSR